jgi:nucleotide-binding universal stress UspA family protein
MSSVLDRRGRRSDGLDTRNVPWNRSGMKNATVVVGTDLSSSAGEALSQAAAWAKRRNAGLVVVHVAPDEIFRALETPQVTEALRARVDAATGGLGLSIDVVLESGTAHSALVRAADERGADLLVVGPSGESTGSHPRFGGTAERVVRYAHCPVLVARASSPSISATGPVLATTDFSPDSEHGIDVAAREAEARGVPLWLAHAVYEPTPALSLLGPLAISGPELPNVDRAALRDVARQTLRTLLEANHAQGDIAVLDGPPASAVAEYAAKIGASLVVVATRGRTGLARIALGSVAETITREAPCAVLAVRRDRS